MRDTAHALLGIECRELGGDDEQIDGRMLARVDLDMSDRTEVIWRELEHECIAVRE